MKRNIKIILVSILIIGVGFYYYKESKKPIKVDTVIIKRSDMISEFKESSILEPSDVVSITPAFSDEILFVKKSGTNVKKGDLILTLDTKQLLSKKDELNAKKNSLYGQERMTTPTINSSQIDSVNIAIEAAQEMVNRTKLDEEKYKKLYDAGAIAKVEYEAYARAYDDAIKALEMRKSEKQVLLDSAGKKSGSGQFFGGQRKSIAVVVGDIDSKLEEQNVYADMDGVILNTYFKVGDMSNPAMPIMEIANTENMLAVSEVIVSDAMALKLGQKVKILQHIGEETFESEGEIAEISKNANTKISPLGLKEQRVKVKVKSSKFKDLIVGYDMDIIFETMHLNDRITVPKTAVFREDEKYYIWLIKDNLLDKKQIEIGKETDYDYEVLSGVDEGETVVVDSNNKDLKIGKAVESSDNK